MVEITKKNNLIALNKFILNQSIKELTRTSTLNKFSITLFVKFKKKKQEESEDTKGVIRIRISKRNRQHNGQKKKYKGTYNDLRIKVIVA